MASVANNVSSSSRGAHLANCKVVSAKEPVAREGNNGYWQSIIAENFEGKHFPAILTSNNELKDQYLITDIAHASDRNIDVYESNYSNTKFEFVLQSYIEDSAFFTG